MHRTPHQHLPHTIYMEEERGRRERSKLERASTERGDRERGQLGLEGCSRHSWDVLFPSSKEYTTPSPPTKTLDRWATINVILSLKLPGRINKCFQPTH